MKNHLRRVIREYVCYYQEDRVHDSLSKDTPSGRPIEPRAIGDASLTALPRLGGLNMVHVATSCIKSRRDAAVLVRLSRDLRVDSGEIAR